jgi:hypothetical protein
MRRLLLLACAAGILGGVVASASADPLVSDAASASCKRGETPAIVRKQFVCLKVGRTCLASRQADYGRYGFVCKARKLARKSATKHPSPGTTTRATPAPKPGSSRTAPVPLGQPGDLGNGWVVTVTAVNPDASEAILAANMFNGAPPAGRQFFMVAVRATYKGPASSHLDSGYALRAVGIAGVGYTTFNNSCGVLPDPSLDADDPETFTGGTVSGNAACWAIEASDASSLVMYSKPLLSDTTVWFALR